VDGEDPLDPTPTETLLSNRLGKAAIAYPNLDKMTKVTADKGYDWELLRHKLRFEGVKPVIKYREFGYHGVANYNQLDGTTYHQRSNIESTFFALRRKYSESVRARTWFSQFRELVLKWAVRNVELALDGSTG
jgi:IS5 family transposase